MRVRDLERLLIANGAGAAKLDAITRRLRHSGRLPKGGRGANAPEIGPAEAAAILLALAGSAKGAEADLRVAKLEPLRCKSTEASASLLGALTALLEKPDAFAGVQSVRVGRTTRQATFVNHDGTATQYGKHSDGALSDRFSVEGVLPAALLVKVARALQGDAPLPSHAEKDLD
jgi:hypothetical protein